MISIAIPGYGDLALAHLVLDYNGTLACDGELMDGVKTRLIQLAERVTVHVLTADTFGKVQNQVSGIPCKLTILQPGQQDVAKAEYLQTLGAMQTVAVGNGRNDRLMLEQAVLGIAVMLDEGISTAALVAANVVCKDITSALDLLIHPLRLVATLRS